MIEKTWEIKVQWILIVFMTYRVTNLGLIKFSIPNMSILDHARFFSLSCN
jgi:hypothetical protein